MFEEFNESWQVIFWDGIKEISDSQSRMYKDTQKWLDKLYNSNSDIFIVINLNKDSTQDVKNSRSCCISFSYLYENVQLFLGIYLGIQYTKYLFFSELFRPLKEILTSYKHRLIFTCKGDDDVKWMFLNLFKVRIASPVYLLENEQQWKNIIDSTTIKDDLLNSNFQCNLFTDRDGTVIYNDVKNITFNFRIELILDLKEKERFLSYLFHTHQLIFKLIHGYYGL